MWTLYRRWWNAICFYSYGNYTNCLFHDIDLTLGIHLDVDIDMDIRYISSDVEIIRDEWIRLDVDIEVGRHVHLNKERQQMRSVIRHR